jgi:hypothetical protein
MTCEEILDQSIEARYVAETLNEKEAEAFEAHYFGCETCWASVQRALEVRAASGTPVVAIAPIRETATKLPRRVASPGRWAMLAAAAVVVAAGSWLLTRGGGPPGSDSTTAMRGATDTLAVVVTMNGGTAYVSWSRARGASTYRARVLNATGDLLLAREVTDSTVSIAIDSIVPRPSGALFVQVDALDQLHAVLARAPLTRLAPFAPAKSP